MHLDSDGSNKSQMKAKVEERGWLKTKGGTETGQARSCDDMGWCWKWLDKAIGRVNLKE